MSLIPVRFPSAQPKYDLGNEAEFRRQLAVAFGQVSQQIEAFQLGDHTHDATDVVSGEFDDARVQQSNVTQHQAALAIAAPQVTAGTFGVGNYVFTGGIVTLDELRVNFVVGTSGLRIETPSESLVTFRFDSDAWRLYAGGTSTQVFHLTEAGNVSWAGSLTSGSVPAARVTAGTFGVGGYIFEQNTAWSSSQSSNVDSIFIRSTGGTAGIGNFGASIGFGKIASGSTARRAAIAVYQVGSDDDAVALSFWTHTSGLSTDPLELVARFGGSGNLASEFFGPLTIKTQGDGETLLHLNSERGWKFLQEGTGGAAALVLRTDTISKAFDIQDADGTRAARFLTSPSGYSLHLTADSEVLRIQSSSTTGSPYLSFYQSSTLRAYIQYQDSSDILVINNNGVQVTLRTNGDFEATSGDVIANV